MIDPGSAGASVDGEMVVLEGMTRRYGSVTAVDGLTLDVKQGEMFGIIGPDGAGKTTTLRVILGILAAGSGKVLTCGLNPAKRRRAISARVGYLSQRFSLYGDLSVDENIAFFAAVHGVRGWKPRREDLLDRLRLAPFRGRLAEQLSGGMKQKLALACTLIHTPELLILDEPTTGVDPVSRRDFWKILVGLQREGLTILLTTPYLDEAERCQRVALMDHGRLLALGTPGSLRALSQGATLELIASPRRRAAEILRGLQGVGEVETFGERLHVTLRDLPPSGAAEAMAGIVEHLRAAGVTIESARQIPTSLEDIFITRIRGAEASRAAQVEVHP